MKLIIKTMELMPNVFESCKIMKILRNIEKSGFISTRIIFTEVFSEDLSKNNVSRNKT